MKIKSHVLRMVEQKENSSLSSQPLWNHHTSLGLDYLLLDLCGIREKLHGSQCCLGFFFLCSQIQFYLIHYPKETYKFNKNRAKQCLQTSFPTKPPNPSYIKILALPPFPTSLQMQDHLFLLPKSSLVRIHLLFLGACPSAFSIQNVWMGLLPPYALPSRKGHVTMARPIRVLTPSRPCHPSPQNSFK